MPLKSSGVYEALPIVERDWNPLSERDAVSEWAESTGQYKRAFLVSIVDDYGVYSFHYQFATLEGKRLVAVKSRLLELHDVLSRLKNITDKEWVARWHLSFYLDSIGKVPDWGTYAFYERKDNSLIYILRGPNEDAQITRHENRKVIKNKDGSLIYGPKF